MRHYQFRHRLLNAAMVQSDLIIAPALEWGESVDSLDRSWCVVHDEDQVLALRLGLDLTMAPTVEPASAPRKSPRPRVESGTERRRPR
jgi:hypothetical protein